MVIANNKIYQFTPFNQHYWRDSTQIYADLHAAGADDVEGSSHAGDKLDDLVEALISNTPGTINEEDKVCLGPFAYCGACTVALM